MTRGAAACRSRPPSERPPLVRVIGESGSGKTWLICRLLKILGRRGYRIACVKHHPHGDPDLDPAGKDSWRFCRAGASSVVVAGRQRSLIHRSNPRGGRLEDFLNLMPPADLILAEGFRRENFPKIAVIRGRRRGRPALHPEKNLIAVATDDVRLCPLDGHVRCFPIFDPKGLAFYLERVFLKRRNKISRRSPSE